MVIDDVTKVPTNCRFILRSSMDNLFILVSAVEQYTKTIILNYNASTLLIKL